VLRALGPQIVPPARSWAANPDHPLSRDAPYLLAEHGDEHDIPMLVAALDRLIDDWCGYDALTEGLARILTDAAGGWLAELRDDPIEEDEIRRAVAERLTPS